MYNYNIVVIGAGSAGLVAVKLAHGLGKKVALIEKRKIGGDCTWFGCIPSKALIKSAAIAHDVDRMREFGLMTNSETKLNTDKVMEHVRAVVTSDAAAHPAESYQAEGIDVIFGEAKFLDDHRIKVDGKTISAKKFIICCGSHPMIPSIEGLDTIEYLTNETVFDLDKLPKSLLILGGGPIGIEMASAFNRLGVKVTVLQRSANILKRDDPELTIRLLETLRNEGVNILTTTKTNSFYNDDGMIVADIQNAEGTGKVTAQALLVSVGRRPSIESLDLDKAGVDYDASGIKVDQNLRTSTKNIYAAGDVVPPYLFTHIAEYEAVIAGTNASLPWPVKKTDYENVLWCTYTDPELAQAGLTEARARELYGDTIKVYRWEHTDVDRAKTDLATNGLTKVICDKKGNILGVSILGHAAAELMHEVQLAKSLKKPFSKIASVIHAYPSYSDAVRQPAKKCYIDMLQNSAILKPIKLVTKNKKRKALALAIAVLIALIFILPVQTWIVDALKWTQGLGALGPFFVIAFYIVACVLFLPGSVLTLGAGFIFKLFVGTITVSIGSTLGACAAFLIGRTFGRKWIAKKIEGNEKFTAIDNAVGKQGFKVVLLTRLSPVFPFNLLNYAFGLTKVDFKKYALASWIGMLPGTVMCVYLGAGLRSLTDVATGKIETGKTGQLFFWLGMLATIAVTILITYFAKKELKQAVGENEGDQRCRK